MVKETKSGAPTKAPKTHTTEEEQTHLEGTPRPSPRPSPTPPRTAESSGPPVDDAVASEVETEEDMNTPRGGAGDIPSRKTKIHTTEESRKHLEVHLIEPEDELDGEMLVGVLVQVSFFPSMSQAARDAIRSMALILVGMTLGEAGTPALSTCMEWMVSEFKEAGSSITQSAINEVKTASSALMATSMQFQATATSYQDMLTSKGPPMNPAAVATTMDVRVREREGVKAH